MLSNSQIKLVRSLHLKKYREELQLSIAEGSKLVIDLLKNQLPVKALICTPQWLQENQSAVPKGIEIWQSDTKQIEKISTLKTPSSVMLLLELQALQPAPIPKKNELFLFLDDIRDPGNLGTILRTCDWFGIRNLVLSETTVECSSPKVIQASMGSYGRITMHVEKAEHYIKRCFDAGVMVAGAFMDGEPVHSIGAPKPGLLIIGNEGKGISQQLLPFINKRISIVRESTQNGFPAAESLNASLAAGILLFALKNC
jgi:RNA methyltransferase, TrmH family